MNPLLREIRYTPLLWMLIFVPAALIAARIVPAAHTLLFVLAVLAIVPLAALLSHATEAVSEKTGDAMGGLLNATLGNLTELIIAVTALHAGEYMLVKASIAGAIVTNSLFMLGASFLLGGLRHHVQEYNRAGGRMHSALLLMATIALLAPAAVSELDLARGDVMAAEFQRRPGDLAYRGLRIEPAVLVKDAQGTLCERRPRRDGRGEVADQPCGWNTPRCHGAGGVGERNLR